MQTMKRAGASSRTRLIRKRLYRSRYLYLLLLLPMIYYIVYCYVPMGGVIIAFKKFNARRGIFGSDWVGLKHFRAFASDPYFWNVVRNTFLLNIYNTFWAFPAPILLALLLNELQNQRAKRAIQTVSYMPHFISVVVLCGIVHTFTASDGLINQLRELFGGSPVLYMMKPEYFRTIYISSGIWQNVGWGSIIYLAALSGVDVEQYEAAIVDGAGRGQQMLHITLPGILPTISIMLVLHLGNIMSVAFEKVLLLYTGATYETSDVIATYVYRRGLLQADYSYGTAVGLFQSVIGITFLLSSNYLANRMGGTGLW